MNPKDLVRSGYDAMAESYLASKDPADPVLLGYLEQLAALIPTSARVLDLGCGAGVPATQWLAERYSTVGADLSLRQLQLAQQHAPAAHLIQADLGTLDFPPTTFDAVTAFYSIIHLPREEQPALLARIHRWLTPGGVFLATWPRTNWEGAEPDWEGWGATMWWSHYDAPTNLRLLQEASFAILSADECTTGPETWLWVLAQAQ